MFDIKSFYEAVSVQDAIQALLKDTDAEIISGGTDVLIRVREGKDAGRSLVSIHNLEELKGVKLLEDGNLWIGAGTSFSHITNDPLIQEYIPMLGDAVDMVGGPQIRNTGTIGGNICNGATSADSASTMWTLEADVVLEEIPVDDRGIIQAVETDEDCAMAMSGNHGKLPLHSRMSLYLECDEVFFGPGIAQFLSLIDHTGSMQTACKQMHMSYSKGWKIMKTAERELGYPLLITQSGGAEGGFSQLTPKTKDFLNRFLQMEQEMNSHASRLFEKYFGDER